MSHTTPEPVVITSETDALPVVVTGNPFFLTCESIELAAMRIALRCVVNELSKMNDARPEMDFTTLIRRCKAAMNVKTRAATPLPKETPSALKTFTIYRRLHTDKEAQAVTEDVCMADVQQTPAYPWKWLGTLFTHKAFITDYAVYALDKWTAEKARPEAFPQDGAR